MSLEKIFAKVLSMSTNGQKTGKYDWDYVKKMIKEAGACTTAQVAFWSGVKHGHSQARQWLERWVKEEIDMNLGLKTARNDEGFLVRFKATDGSVYYADVDYVEKLLAEQ